MKFLFNSLGKNIANEVNGQLHSISGQNIGHFLKDKEIFIGMDGRYLGEIIYDDRLVHNHGSQYQNMNFGNYGNYGNVGNYGNPGNHGNISLPSGYMDLDINKLI